MLVYRPLLVAAAALTLAACDGARSMSPAGTQGVPLVANRSQIAGAPVSATGGGHYDLAGLDAQFSFSAMQTPDGKTVGRFHHYVDEGGGLVVDFYGAATCVAEDPLNHRAWIGGIVTQNNSTDPDFLTDIHQPGRDIWFRVLDAGEGSGDPNRTTFTGFQGSAGIQTSAEYCATQPWPAGNARTWPVTGNVDVRP